jgi:LysR family nitrogen assimilation transcriptional regulator
MNLTQLRYFVAVARNNSLSRAATDLHISQPALTRQIKLLEDEFGGGLLQRHARGVSLTDLGQVLLERAERQLRDFEQLRSDMADASVAPTAGFASAVRRR